MKDLAAIPNKTDGKLRVFRCDVIEELDLVKLGLKKPDPKPDPKPVIPKADMGGIGDPPTPGKKKDAGGGKPASEDPKTKTEVDPLDEEIDFSDGVRGPVRLPDGTKNPRVIEELEQKRLKRKPSEGLWGKFKKLFE
jgi:hypothetical protein